ncbi:DUF2079 domain-containing protein [Candidatus Uhrbacteria bacterium]|nr:DUF2079 domain-containing protein [Candidatus Uhrbacteria bacterium]
MNNNLLIFYIIGVTSVLISAVGAYRMGPRAHLRYVRRVCLGLIVLSGYLFLAQYFKYQSLHVFVDFTHWMQLVYQITQTGLPLSPNSEFLSPGTLNYFSVHFVPLIYVVAALFKLISRPETVMVFNVVVMISSALPLYKLARRMNHTHAFAVCMAALLLWYPTFQYITLYEFEMLRFSIPVLLWMLYFFETRRSAPYVFFVLLAVLVREEVGLTVGMFGVYAWFHQKRRFDGMMALILGFGGFVLITSALMPALRGGEYIHVAGGAFSQFGNSPAEILWSAISHPFVTIKAMLEITKIANVFMLGLPLLFIPLAAPSVLVTAVNIGVGLLSDVPFYISYMLYYIAPSVPFIFYALLKAWPKIEARFHSYGATNALVAAVVMSNIVFGPSPLSLQFWFKQIRPAPFRTEDFHWSVYRVTNHHRAIDDVATLIPDSAIVSAPQFLHPRLFKKRGILVFPALQSKDGKWQAQYVLLDTSNNGLKSESPAFVQPAAMAVVRGEGKWDLVKNHDAYELYRRVSDL